MARLKLKNNAKTTLTATMTAVATTATVADAAALPDCPFRCTVDDEIIEVGAKDTVTNTLSSILRALEGTAAAEHNSGAEVQVRFTAGVYDQMLDEVDLSQYKRGVTAVDAYGYPTAVEYRRKDDTIAIKYTMSNANESGYYQTVTEEFFDTAGTAIIKTVTYTLTYLDNGLIDTSDGGVVS